MNQPRDKTRDQGATQPGQNVEQPGQQQGQPDRGQHDQAQRDIKQQPGGQTPGREQPSQPGLGNQTLPGQQDQSGKGQRQHGTPDTSTDPNRKTQRQGNEEVDQDARRSGKDVG